MKRLVLTLGLLSGLASAQDLPGTEVIPKFMKDGTITVQLKDGKKYIFSTNEYKVVRRGSKRAEPVEQIVVAQQPDTTNRNRVQLHGGVGYKGFDTSVNSSDIVVREKRVPVFGVSYFRLLDNDASIGASIFTNGVITLGVGKDF